MQEENSPVNDTGAELATEIKASALTGAEISRRSGVSAAYISTLLRGKKKNPSPETVSKIRRALSGEDYPAMIREDSPAYGTSPESRSRERTTSEKLIKSGNYQGLLDHYLSSLSDQELKTLIDRELTEAESDPADARAHFEAARYAINHLANRAKQQQKP